MRRGRNSSISTHCMRTEFRIVSRIVAWPRLLRGRAGGDHRQGQGAALAAGDAGGGRRPEVERHFAPLEHELRPAMTSDRRSQPRRSSRSMPARPTNRPRRWLDRLAGPVPAGRWPACRCSRGSIIGPIVCGFGRRSTAGSRPTDARIRPRRCSSRVIDLVAAVGLWLAAPWGAVVWLTSVDLDGGGRDVVSRRSTAAAS